MKTEFNFGYIIILLTLIFGCQKQKPNNAGIVEKTINIDSLIEVNKDRQLFLSFWSGMSKKEFEEVLKYETNRGRLKNDKFIFYEEEPYNKGFEFLKFELEPNFENDSFLSSLSLLYEYDFYKSTGLYNISKMESDFYLKTKSITDLYDEKYVKNKYIKNPKSSLKEVGSPCSGYSLVKDDKSYYTYFASDKVKRYIEILVSEKISEDEISGSTFSNRKDESECKLAELRIFITYQLLSDYLKWEEKKNLRMEERERNIIDKKKSKGEEIKKNNSLL